MNNNYLVFFMGGMVGVLTGVGIWMYRNYTRHYIKEVNRVNKQYETTRFRKNMTEIGAEEYADIALSKFTSVRQIRKENNKIERKLKMSREQSDRLLQKWKIKQLNKKNHDKETV